MIGFSRGGDGQLIEYQAIARVSLVLLKSCMYSFPCVNERQIYYTGCDCSLYFLYNVCWTI